MYKTRKDIKGYLSLISNPNVRSFCSVKYGFIFHCNSCKRVPGATNIKDYYWQGVARAGGWGIHICYWGLGTHLGHVCSLKQVSQPQPCWHFGLCNHSSEGLPCSLEGVYQHLWPLLRCQWHQAPNPRCDNKIFSTIAKYPLVGDGEGRRTKSSLVNDHYIKVRKPPLGEIICF